MKNRVRCIKTAPAVTRACGFCGDHLFDERRKYCSVQHYWEHRKEKAWSFYIQAGVDPVDVPSNLFRRCSAQKIEDIRSRAGNEIPAHIIDNIVIILRRVAREERIDGWKDAYEAGLTFAAIAAKCGATPQAVRQAVAAQHDYHEVKASHLRSLAEMVADRK